MFLWNLSIVLSGRLSRALADIRRKAAGAGGFCLLILMMLLSSGTASAEPLGWGYVNATDVALRRGIGGKVLTRLPLDTCVWINDSQTDSSGVLWYEIRTGLNINHTNYDYSGWMKAPFINAGADVWHDVTAIAASNCGLIALRADGNSETAGRPIVAMDGSGWVSPRGWAAPYGKAIRVGVPTTGNEYFIVTEANELVSTVNGLRVADGLRKAAALEAAEAVICDVPFPAWRQDAETVVFRSAGIAPPRGNRPIEIYIGVRADGSVIAEPAFMAALLADWNDLTDLRLTSRYVMGLKKDGRVLLAPYVEGVDLDVSHWQGITAIGAGNDWCVGLQADGTLIFAGDHIFMNEGHTRK